MKIDFIFVTTVVSLLTVTVAAENEVAAPDPCQVYKKINEWKRSTGYEVGNKETPLCDINLERGWYRFQSAAGGKMPETCPQGKQCGTLAPIWLRGSHPTTVGTVEIREVCVHLATGGPGDNCCQRSSDIGVVNCGDYFVYFLFPTPACPMAYCAGEVATCPAGKYSSTGLPPCQEAYPNVTAPPTLAGPEILNGDRKYYRFSCEINVDETNENQAFEVHWVRDGELDSPLKTEVVEEPSRTAYLEGSDLKGKYGTKIACRVRSFYKDLPEDLRGPWFTSNWYWAGVRAEPPALVVTEADDSQTITVTSTIPVVCDWAHDPGECCITIRLHAAEGQREATFQKRCEEKMCKKDWDPVTKRVEVTFPVKATIDQMPKTRDEFLVLRFETEDNANIGVNDPNNVQLRVKDAPTASCNAWGDPHIKSIDQHSYEYHLYLIGDFTFFRNLQRHFEVQIRTWQCSGTPTCICGVAVREKNDVVIVDACDDWSNGKTGTTPQLSVARPLSDGTTVWKSSNGHKTIIYLPSSSEVMVESGGSSMSVTLTIPATDKGQGQGICGTFDGDATNELTHKNGFVDPVCNNGGNCVPYGFMESWRATESLFEEDQLPAPLNEPSDFKYCVCDEKRGVQFINCTARADITGRLRECIQQDNCKRQDLNEGGRCTQRIEECLPGSWRSKRDTEPPYADLDEPAARHYNPNDHRTDEQFTVPTWPTKSGITEQTAEAKCREAMQNSQLYARCAQNQDAPVIDLESCKLDILITDSFGLLNSFTDGFTTNCQDKLASNPDNFETTPEGENVLKQEYSTDICGSVCLEHGRCGLRGQCICNEGYRGDTCQLLDGKGPQLEGIRGPAFCDVNQRPCRKVYIDASNLEETDDFACKVQEILPDGSLFTDRANMMQEAEFLTNAKMACALPDARIKSERSVKRFVISATTDGSLYGNTLNLTVFDSICQNCTQDGCYQLPDTCLISDLCYADGARNPNDNSQMCIPAESTSQWIKIYPHASVDITGPDDGGSVTCTVVTSDNNPKARYKVSWYVDEEAVTGTEEQELEAGTTELEVDRATMIKSGGPKSPQPAVRNATCKVRSYYTDRNILSPYVESGALPLRSYPAITVTLSGPDDGRAMVCTVSTTDSDPNARYKVSWYVNGQKKADELGVSQDRTTAVFSRKDFPATGMLTCKMRSYYTDMSDVFSPHVASNALDLARI